MIQTHGVRATPADRRLRALGWGAAALSVALAIAIAARSILRRPFFFDDAFVYWRYAQHLQQGLGLSWNPDGVPTHGLASPLWCFVLSPLTRLPLAAARALPLASWLTGSLALLVLAVTVSRNATSVALKSTPLALALVALPLLVSPHFAYHLTTGMDTMLSLLANALLAMVVLEYVRAPVPSRALLASSVAFIAVLARPENLVCSLAVPVIAWLGYTGKPRWKNLAALIMPNLILDAAYLMVCERHFGSALPADFFGKSLDAFKGFIGSENALSYAFTTLLCLLPFAGALSSTLKYRRDTTIAALLIPPLATMGGLLLCRQHMGFEGRFYMPYAAYLITAALLCLDAGLAADSRVALRRALIGIASACVVFAVSIPVQHYADRQFSAWEAQRPVQTPSLQIAAPAALPATDWEATTRLVGQTIALLPPAMAAASAEVGYLGYASPQRTIIDLTGINDDDIARHGFDTDRMLARAPDIIWLPPLDYTGLRTAILANQNFATRYQLIDGAFNNGIAIRRDSPFRTDIDRELKSAWDSLYPQHQLADYVVRHIAAH